MVMRARTTVTSSSNRSASELISLSQAVSNCRGILPDPLFQPQQRASDADRDTAVDILCAAVAERRLTLTE